MVSSRHHPFRPPPAGLPPGTGIATDRGEVAVADLAQGDRILTRDHGYQPLAWCGVVPAHPRHGAAPIRIAPDRFGPGLPRRPLDLGPGHRLLLAGAAVALHTGEQEALATADHLRPGGTPARPGARLHQVLLRGHELILANGLWCESAFADAPWFDALPADLRDSLRARIGAPHDQAARHCLGRHETVAILGPSARRDGLAA